MSNFWTDLKFLTNDEKLMYVYLVKNRFSNICGCYHINKSDIAVDLLMSVNYVKLLLQQLSNKHIISYNNITNEILIIDMYKYVAYDKLNNKKIEEIMKKIINDNYRKYIKSIYIDMEIIPVEDTVKSKKNVNKDINILTKQVIDYLNEKCNTNYKSNANYIQKHISARMSDGYADFDDYKHVIDMKYSQWKNTDYEKYLRPQTLFGTKFDSYLNEYYMKNKINKKAEKQEEHPILNLWD